MKIRVPTFEDYARYDGAHCHRLWTKLPKFWRSPAWDRSRDQIMRWTTRRRHEYDPE